MDARSFSVAAFVCFAGGALAADARSFATDCGGAHFRVEQRMEGHPLSNTFDLLADGPGAARLLFRSDEGGWFHAACTSDKQGKPLLVFQSYCGGSACVEDRYGAMDPKTLKLVLRPTRGNVSNSKRLADILGRPAPYLPREKSRFCCD